MNTRKRFLEVVTLATITALLVITVFLSPHAAWRWWIRGPATVTAAQTPASQSAPPSATAVLAPPCLPDPRANVLACEFTRDQKKDVIIAQQDVQIAYMQYQNALASMNGLLVKLSLENKWPENLQFDAQNKRLIGPLPPVKEPAKQPEKKPDGSR
jgi:hypothetical protein